MNKFIKYSITIILIVGLILFLLHLSIEEYPKEYSSLPIRAQVIDSDTKEPLGDVIVVAAWVLEGGLEGGYTEALIQLMEAETDEKGEFYFPAWGPVKVPIFVSSNARLKQYSPKLIIFKSGYAPLILFSKYSRGKIIPTLIYSDWNGKQILLEKVYFQNELYLRKMGSLNSSLTSYDKFISPAPSLEKCIWKLIPQTLIALKHEEERGIGLKGATMYSSLLSDDKRHPDNRCGSFEKFLEENENEN